MNILLKASRRGGLACTVATSLFFTGPIFVREGQAEKYRGSAEGLARVAAPRAVGGKAGIVGGGEECIRAI